MIEVDVHIDYPRDPDRLPDWEGDRETLKGHLVGTGLVQLREHSWLIPLGPLDVVACDQLAGSDDLIVSGIQSLQPIWTYQVTFHLPKNESFRIGEKTVPLMEDWNREAYCTWGLDSVAHVSSANRAWLKNVVLKHPYVERVELVRTPTLKLKMGVAVRNTSLANDWGGPWA